MGTVPKKLLADMPAIGIRKRWRIHQNVYTYTPIECMQGNRVYSVYSMREEGNTSVPVVYCTSIE